MSTVYLLFTRHKELGECNVTNLLAILNRIKPDVIFEELDADLFDYFYRQDEHPKLESDAIKRYRAEYPVIQVPVDVLHWRYDRFSMEHERMFKLVEGQATQAAFHFRNALDEQQSNMRIHGFRYLNSHYNDDLQNEIDRLRHSILNQMQDADLQEIDRRMTEIHHQRELTMIHTIYDYAKKHPFETGVFYIGSAHRRGILEHIEHLEQQEERMIHWIKSLD